MRHSFWLLAALVGVASVCLAAPALTAATTFSNSGAITINDATPPVWDFCSEVTPGQASPYPSQITVSGLGTAVSDVNVTLTGLTHPFPDDVGVLLVGLAGQSTLLMTDSGGDSGVSGVNLTFDDAATGSLPDDSQITSGTYKPTVGSGHNGECAAPSPFPSAPTGPYGSSLSVFNGTNPNDTWSLYVIDDTPGGAGSISGGWSLDITTGKTPEQKLGDLQDLVAGMGIHHGITNALESKLQNALAALAADDSAGACFWTQSFLDLVTAQTGKKISSGKAQQLTDAANEIRADLAC
jgi:hypothetical protein